MFGFGVCPFPLLKMDKSTRLKQTTNRCSIRLFDMVTYNQKSCHCPSRSFLYNWKAFHTFFGQPMASVLVNIIVFPCVTCHSLTSPFIIFACIFIFSENRPYNIKIILNWFLNRDAVTFYGPLILQLIISILCKWLYSLDSCFQI